MWNVRKCTAKEFQPIRDCLHPLSGMQYSHSITSYMPNFSYEIFFKKSYYPQMHNLYTLQLDVETIMYKCIYNLKSNR